MLASNSQTILNCGCWLQWNGLRMKISMAAAGRLALICSFFEPGCNRFIIVTRSQCCWLKLPSLPFLPQLRLPLISLLLSCLCLLELSLFLLIRSPSINDVDPGKSPWGIHSLNSLYSQDEWRGSPNPPRHRIVLSAWVCVWFISPCMWSSYISSS